MPDHYQSDFRKAMGQAARYIFEHTEAQKAADEHMKKIVEETMRKRNEMIETLVLARIRLTGEDVRDLELREETVFEPGGKSYRRWYFVERDGVVARDPYPHTNHARHHQNYRAFVRAHHDLFVQWLAGQPAGEAAEAREKEKVARFMSDQEANAYYGPSHLRAYYRDFICKTGGGPAREDAVPVVVPAVDRERVVAAAADQFTRGYFDAVRRTAEAVGELMTRPVEADTPHEVTRAQDPGTGRPE